MNIPKPVKKQAFDAQPISESSLKFYCYGRAAADKDPADVKSIEDLNSRTLEVLPLEDAPLFVGEYNDQTQEITSTAYTQNGTAYTTSVSAACSVKAYWMDFNNPNRVAPPNVKKGEMIALYKLADSETYFWMTLGDDSYLRRCETAIFLFGADPNNEPSLDNAYYLLISGHFNKFILHTSANNGEVTTYDVAIEGKEGILHLRDGLGNEFLIDSKCSRLLMRNDQGAYVELLGKALKQFAQDSITQETNSFTLKAASATLDAPTTITQDVTAQAKLQANSLKSQSSIEATGSVKGDKVFNANRELIS